jgi:hypothetical protein
VKKPRRKAGFRAIDKTGRRQARQPVAPKKRRGPEKGAPTNVRLQPAELKAIDDWAAQQADKPSSRPETIRRMIEQVIGASKRKR